MSAAIANLNNSSSKSKQSSVLSKIVQVEGSNEKDFADTLHSESDPHDSSLNENRSHHENNFTDVCCSELDHNSSVREHEEHSGEYLSDFSCSDSVHESFCPNEFESYKRKDSKTALSSNSDHKISSIKEHNGACSFQNDENSPITAPVEKVTSLTDDVTAASNRCNGSPLENTDEAAPADRYSFPIIKSTVNTTITEDLLVIHAVGNDPKNNNQDTRKIVNFLPEKTYQDSFLNSTEFSISQKSMNSADKSSTKSHIHNPNDMITATLQSDHSISNVLASQSGTDNDEWEDCDKEPHPEQNPSTRRVQTLKNHKSIANGRKHSRYSKPVQTVPCSIHFLRYSVKGKTRRKCRPSKRESSFERNSSHENYQHQNAQEYLSSSAIDQNDSANLESNPDNIADCSKMDASQQEEQMWSDCIGIKEHELSRSNTRKKKKSSPGSKAVGQQRTPKRCHASNSARVTSSCSKMYVEPNQTSHLNLVGDRRPEDKQTRDLLNELISFNDW